MSKRSASRPVKIGPRLRVLERPDERETRSYRDAQPTKQEFFTVGPMHASARARRQGIFDGVKLVFALLLAAGVVASAARSLWPLVPVVVLLTVIAAWRIRIAAATHALRTQRLQLLDQHAVRSDGRSIAYGDIDRVVSAKSIAGVSVRVHTSDGDHVVLEELTAEEAEIVKRAIEERRRAG